MVAFLKDRSFFFEKFMLIIYWLLIQLTLNIELNSNHYDGYKDLKGRGALIIRCILLLRYNHLNYASAKWRIPTEYFVNLKFFP